MIESMNGQEMTQINIREKLISRMPQGWAKHVSCEEGWDWILIELENKLNYIDPDYTIMQVKEKFGTLRFYYGTDKDSIAGDIMDDCVNAACYESSCTCEHCGKSNRRSVPPGMSPTGERIEYDKTVRLRDRSWIKNLCDACDKLDTERAK